MSIPPADTRESAAAVAPSIGSDAGVGSPWPELSAPAKRERLLCAASEVFATSGMDAPMPAIAAHAAASVGSLYRQFPSKRELLAALVVDRLSVIERAGIEAAERPGSHWQALTGMLWGLVERQAADDFLGEAWNHVAEHEDVIAAAAKAVQSIERLIDACRDEGSIRPDATALDVRLVFVAARASRQVDTDAWRRAVTLIIDGLSAERSSQSRPSAPVGS
jgi:AcrR family transcriptional regulator